MSNGESLQPIAPLLSVIRSVGLVVSSVSDGLHVLLPSYACRKDDNDKDTVKEKAERTRHQKAYRATERYRYRTLNSSAVHRADFSRHASAVIREQRYPTRDRHRHIHIYRHRLT